MNFCRILLVALLGQTLALAHSSELRLTMTHKQKMILKVVTPDGQPVSWVKLEYRVNRKPAVKFIEGNDGQYTAPAPKASNIPIQLEIDDVTFPEEITRVSITTVYPPSKALELIMPPATANYLRAGVLLPILIAPIVLVAIAVGWLFARQHR